MTEHITSPLAPEFLPLAQGHHFVDNYRDSLCNLYTETGMQHLDFDHWKMTELVTYKNKKTALKHEYLIATFTDSANRNVRLRIERQIQVASSAPTDTDNDEQNDGQIVQLGMRVTDHVSLYPGVRPENNSTTEHITFREGHRISLPKFVLLACVVRECSRAHPLRRANSYWFCFAMTEALKARCPEHDLLPVQGRKQRATGLMLLVDMFYRNVNVDELLAKADQMWNQYIGQLQIQANVTAD